MITMKLFRQVVYTCLGLLFIVGGNAHVYGQKSPDSIAKVALVYSVTTPELKEDMEREIRKELKDVKIINYEYPEIFEEIKSLGYMKAIEEGADAIVSVCSTVGEVAYSMQDAARFLGVPIIIVNDEMCREAVRKGERIAVVATFQTAIDPTKNIVLRVAREMGKHVELSEVLVEGGFGLEKEQFVNLMESKIKAVADDVDVIVFAQGSMAYCEEQIARKFNRIVLSNPKFSAKALRETLVSKGVISE